jgi:LmbE family N-acetylglucosaminyl deacetylase
MCGVAVELVVDDLHPGTDEQTWLSGSRLGALLPFQQRRPGRLIVVAPHPDDEVLAAGGLLQQMQQAGVETVLVAVTDGEASHPGGGIQGHDLIARRIEERRVALRRLGCGSVRVERLCLPDGSVAEQSQYLTDELSRLLRPDDLCVAPWRSDGHPDHDATGRAAIAAACLSGARVLEYLVWAWHWATPDDAFIPWGRCRRLDLPRRQIARKRWATYAFTSQIRTLDNDDAGPPVLTDSVLRRFWRPFEVFIETES